MCYVGYMFKYLILSTLLVTQLVMAADGPVTHLNKGDPAPYEGYHFTLAKELEVRQGMLELDTDKLIIDNNQKLLTLKDAQVVILNDQVKLWQDQSKALAEQVVAKENSRFWYFVLGCATTTALAFAVNKATK